MCISHRSEKKKKKNRKWKNRPHVIWSLGNVNRRNAFNHVVHAMWNVHWQRCTQYHLLKLAKWQENSFKKQNYGRWCAANGTVRVYERHRYKRNEWRCQLAHQPRQQAIQFVCGVKSFWAKSARLCCTKASWLRQKRDMRHRYHHLLISESSSFKCVGHFNLWNVFECSPTSYVGCAPSFKLFGMRESHAMFVRS